MEQEALLGHVLHATDVSPPLTSIILMMKDNIPLFLNAFILLILLYSSASTF